MLKSSDLKLSQNAHHRRWFSFNDGLTKFARFRFCILVRKPAQKRILKQLLETFSRRWKTFATCACFQQTHLLT